ncbi:phosphocarrier protein HPr [Sphaerisporangium melleum]|uniref:Phosphocarrier protein HPr n=1 Tax=Sphaerisporangium melleum TaxID=321316 RepID=A0A917VDS0_9ACTN|nr:HPr family phosphocarrier protein [Sphaerisporangium melleum]GGK64636.1 phosphocarrier protein HPr [Sphaerisporangium melleum]GII70053.1 phosphocarrier protein HPr [Sphaerisporangium melleum]
MAVRKVIVESSAGLHARPAATFVQTAAKAPVDVTVAKPGGTPVSAKSILSILALDVRSGEVIVLNADGDGADQVLDELAAIVSVP